MHNLIYIGTFIFLSDILSSLLNRCIIYWGVISGGSNCFCDVNKKLSLE